MHEPNVDAFEALADDGVWADKPLWMLNIFAYHSGDEAREANRHYARLMSDILASVGARVVMQAPVALSLIGPKPWQAAAIVEYPSPAAFLTMATSNALADASDVRRAAFADQFLIPVSAGWMPGFDPDKPVRPRVDATAWTPQDLDTPNAFIGDHHAQASVESAREFVGDARLDQGPVWMLNLMKYAPGVGKSAHDGYVAGGGDNFPGGSLGRQFGLRVVYSARRTGRSLIGATDWDSIAIVSYPSRDYFLTMGANADYIALHEGRKAGLQETYIIAMRAKLRDR